MQCTAAEQPDFAGGAFREAADLGDAAAADEAMRHRVQFLRQTRVAIETDRSLDVGDDVRAAQYRVLHLRLRCEQFHAKKLVVSRKKRGVCPCFGARRMAVTAALHADEALPERPPRRWVPSLPISLRFPPASSPAVLWAVLGVVYRAISSHLLAEAGLTRTCTCCRGRLRVIASIEEPEVNARIVEHRDRDCGTPEPELGPIAARAVRGRRRNERMRGSCRSD